MRVGVFSLALAFCTAVWAEDRAPILSQNPVFERIHAEDPALAAQALKELEEILLLPQAAVTRDLSELSPNIQSVLRENALFGEAYRKDPKRVVKLIEVILRRGETSN